MRKVDMSVLPAPHTRIPSDFHPANYLAHFPETYVTDQVGGTLKALYSSWAEMEDTINSLQDKAKGEKWLSNAHHSALKKAEASVGRLKESIKRFDETIFNSLTTKSDRHSAELRSLVRDQKTPVSKLVKEIESDPALARACYDVSPKLLGLTAEDYVMVRQHIERTYAKEAYEHRVQAEAGIALIERATDALHTRNMKRLVDMSNSDDAIIAKATAAQKPPKPKVAEDA